MASLLIIFTETCISGFSSIIGITVMPCLLLVIFTLVAYVLIINAFNLIDGVDGLAGDFILMDSVAFGFVFCREEDNSMIVLLVASVRSILPFCILIFRSAIKSLYETQDL